MSLFHGEIIADYTMAAPILYFKSTDEQLYKDYKQKSLELMKEFQEKLKELNGTPNGTLYTPFTAFA